MYEELEESEKGKLSVASSKVPSMVYGELSKESVDKLFEAFEKRKAAKETGVLLDKAKFEASCKAINPAAEELSIDDLKRVAVKEAWSIIVGYLKGDDQSKECAEIALQVLYAVKPPMY